MKKIFIFLTFILLLNCSLKFETGEGKRYGLVYGINDYKNVSPDLNCAVADAVGIYSNFMNYGYELIIRTDSEASKSNISNDIVSTVAKLQPEDTLLFYFSGHGLLTNDISYIAPYDADLNNIETFISEIELFQWLKESKTEKVLLVFDHCFSGAYIAYRRFFVMTASKKYEYSYEFSNIGHGLFTYYFLKGMENKRADVTGDGIVTFSEMFYYVERNVTNSVYDQHPQFLGKTNVEYVLF